MTDILAEIDCPLCGAPGTQVRVSHGPSGGVRGGFRALTCSGPCKRYHVEHGVYTSLPLPAKAAIAFAAEARRLAAEGKGEELVIDPPSVRSLA